MLCYCRYNNSSTILADTVTDVGKITFTTQSVISFTSNQYARKKELFTVTFNKRPNPAKHSLTTHFSKLNNNLCHCLQIKGHEPTRFS